MPDSTPDTTVYVQPSVRQSITWTPPLIRTALMAADGGSLITLADLCDAMLGDDRLPGVFESRFDTLLGIEVTFEEGLRRPRARRKGGAYRDPAERSDIVLALEEDGDYWTISPEPEVKQIMTWGYLLGVCPVELVYPKEPDYQRGGRVIPTLKFWHPKHLRFDWGKRAWFLKTSDAGTETELTPGNGKWALFMPYGTFRPWALGMWRGLAPWWLLKQYARDDWGRHSEKASMLVLTETETHVKENRKQLAADIYAQGRAAVAALPKGFGLQLVEASANTRAIYEAQLDFANNAFAIRVLGGNLTTEVEAGSLAAARVHGQVKGERLRTDGETWSTFQHDQILPHYAAINFGAEVLAPWPVYDTEPAEDQSAKAAVLVQVAGAYAQFKTNGVELDLDELKRDYGIPFSAKQPEPPAAPAAPEPPANKPPTDEQQMPEQMRGKGAMGKGSGQTMMQALMARVFGATGFVEGQGYVDSVVDHATQQGAQALGSYVDDLLSRVEGAGSLEDARAAVLAAYKDAPDPDDLAAAAEAVFTMGTLAGMAAVAQDAPELLARKPKD